MRSEHARSTRKAVISTALRSAIAGLATLLSVVARTSTATSLALSPALANGAGQPRTTDTETGSGAIARRTVILRISVVLVVARRVDAAAKLVKQAYFSEVLGIKELWSLIYLYIYWGRGRISIVYIYISLYIVD